MIEQQQHEMQLETIHTSGAEEWYCPACGRRFLMQWPPAYKKIVLEAGDEYASHSGGKGGLRIGPPQITLGNETGVPALGEIELTEEEEMRLRPWADWLEKVDFDALWDGDNQ